MSAEHSPGQFELQPASNADFDSLLELRTAAMRDSLERLGRFDPARSRERFSASFMAEHTRHIVVDGERVGFFALRPAGDDDGWCLDHFYIHPRWQGRGIGGQVMAALLEPARHAGQPVRLGALRGSDANRLYERHGFVKTHETQWDLHYVWRGR